MSQNGCNCNSNDSKFLKCSVEVPCFGVADPDEFPTLGASSPFRTIWKQIDREETATIPCGLPDIGQVTSLTVTPVIKNTKVIRTPPRVPATVTSEENQKLTGYKLCVEGVLCQKITYCTDCGKQFCFDVARPFSTYIVLPAAITQLNLDPFDIAACFKITPYVECCFIDKLDKRTVFKNIVFFLAVCL